MMLQLKNASLLKSLLIQFTVLLISILTHNTALAQPNKAPVNPFITTAPVPNNTSVATAISPLNATDPSSTVASYTIATLPQSWLGVLYVNRVAAEAGQVITPTQATQLSFQPIIRYESDDAFFTFTSTDEKGSKSAPATYAIPIVHDIDLTLAHTIQASVPFTNGQEVTVRFSVTNEGTFPVWDGVFIKNFLPAELTFIRAASGDNWRYDASQNTWNVQELEGTATKAYEIIARMNSDNSFSHNAIVDLISKKQKDMNLANNSSTYTLWLDDDMPAVENVSVTLAATTTEGTVSTISPLRASHMKEGRSINNFTLTSVPDPSNGKLYVKDRMAKEGQKISPEEASELSFEPAPAFEGESIFRYTATDNFGATSISEATYNITVMSSTLPVSLIDFSTKPQANGVTLAWATASEQENDFFSVERSQDGLSFMAIGKVKGAGNSSRRVDYSFLDKQAPAGVVYYRLKQVDTDGTHEYSKVVTVTARGVVANLQVQAYPNPFSQQLQLAMPASSAGQAQLQLLDLQGRVVLTQTVSLEQGENKLELSTEMIPAGAYILSVSGNGINSRTKVIKS